MCKIRFLMMSVGLFTALQTTADAQCSRGGGRGGTAGGGFSPLVASTGAGFNSPLASFNSISGPSPNATFLANLAAAQMVQQQYLIAQQQRAIFALEQTPRNLAAQAAARRPGGVENSSATSASRESSPLADQRRQRIRDEYAAKLLTHAQQAEADGRSGTAEKYYRRVEQILPAADARSRTASAAVTRLEQRKEHKSKSGNGVLVAQSIGGAAQDR